MAKQTEHFDCYADFLDSLISKGEVEQKQILKRIDVYKRIKDIIIRRSNGERIAPKEYAALAKCSCPEKSFISLFNGEIESSESFFPDEDMLLNDCPRLTCKKCWEQYINEVAKAINESDLAVKKMEDTEHDN